MMIYYILLIYLYIYNVMGAVHEAHTITAFEKGDEVIVECKYDSDEWSPLWECVEPSKVNKKGESEKAQPTRHLSFPFGTDVFSYCGVSLKKKEDYERMRKVIKQEEALICRVPMTKDPKPFYLPISISIWGLVEPSHLHINYHMNFVFHEDKGKIMGATIYPVRDRFQYVRQGTIVNFHGPVRWFNRHSFASTSDNTIKKSHVGVHADPANIFTLIGWIGLTIIACSLGFVLIYSLLLKPSLVRKLLKKD